MGEEKQQDGYRPTAEELKARQRRNVAIALVLVAFMVFVFLTLVTKGIIPSLSDNA